MCKMIGFSKLPKGIKESKLNGLLVKAAKLLGESQRDGFGVAISHGKQQLYRERHLTATTFNGLGSMDWTTSSLPKNLRTKIKNGVDFDKLGKLPSLLDGTGPVVLHGRTATCDKSITNTHPFIKHDERLGNVWTMAHNGVVNWDGDEKLPTETTCDSEHLLNCYAFLNGEESFKGRISGYAATLGISPLGEFFAFRDNRAPLYIAYSQELDLSIVATDETHAWDLMTDLCKMTKTKISKVGEPMMLDDWTAHTWSIGGEIAAVSVLPFDSGYGKISSSYVSKAFGTTTPAYDPYSRDTWDYGYGSYGSSTTAKTTTPGFKQIDDETKKLTSELRLNNQSQLQLGDERTLTTMIDKVESNPSAYTDEIVREVKKMKIRKGVSDRRRAKLMLDGKSSQTGSMTVEEYNYILHGDPKAKIATKPVSDIDQMSEEQWKRLADIDQRVSENQADSEGYIA